MSEQQIIGYAALQVIPVLSGLEGNLSTQLQAPLVSAGRSAGQATGRAIAGGLEQAQAAVEKASEALKTAREKDADAAGKVRVAEQKLQELRDKGSASASQLARAEEAVATAQRNADRQTRATQRAVQDLSDARANAANAANQATESEGRFHGALGKLTEKIDPAVGKMAGLAAATAGVGSAMELASDAIGNEKLNSKLAAQLGATPQMAAEFGHIAGQLYADAYGEDLSQVNDALKSVWQQGLVGEDANDAEIQKVTASVLNLASAFDEDVTGATAAVGTMLKTGLATNAQEAMDILTRGFQQGADKGQDLFDTFVEYPTLFRSLGLDGSEAMGLISQALGAGARNADQVADALKEFQLRAIDGSESTADAYKALGLDAKAMGAQMAEGGEAANQGLATVLERLRGIEDPVKKNAAAVGLFGTKAEDLAQALFAMDPTTAVSSLGQVTGAADQLDQTLNGNTATSLEKFKRGIHEAMVEKAGEAVHWIQENKSTAMIFGGVLGTVAGAIVAVKVATVAWTAAQTIASGATAIWTGIQWLWNAAMTANPIGIVVVAIAALVGGIIYAYTHSEKFREIVSGAFEAVKNAALFLWNNVLKPYYEWWIAAFQKIGEVALWLWDNGIKPAFDGISAGAQQLWNDFLSPIFTDIKILIGLVGDAGLWLYNTALKPAIDGIGSALSWLWTTAAEPALDGMKTGLRLLGDAATWLYENGIKPAFDGIGSLIGAIWKNTVSPAFDAMKSGIGLLGDAFGAAGNLIKGVWNGVLDNLRPVAHAIGKALSAIPDKIGPFEVPGADTAHGLGKTLQAFRGGGPVSGPGTGTSDSILAWVSNGEFIEPEASVTPETLPILEAIRAGWVPSPEFVAAMVGEIPGYAGGGTVQVGNGDITDVQRGMWAALTTAFPDAILTSATRYQDVGSGYDYHMQGKAVDVSGPHMVEMAEWIAKNYPGSLELIHSEGFSHNIKNGSDVGNGMSFYGSGTMADHADHVHWAMSSAPAMPAGEQGSGATLSPGGGNGGGGNSGGGGGNSAGGGNSSPGTSGGTRPAGNAVPVWVDNWPSSFGTSSTPASPVGGQNVDTAHNTPSATPQSDPGAGTPQSQPTSTEYKARQHPLQGAAGTGELFNGDAPWWYDVKSPEEALTNLQGQAQNQWGKTQSDVQTWLQDSWKEMLSTGAAVLGMGAVGGGGGDTYNITAPDPMSAATAVARNQRRRTLAVQRQGGIAR